MATYQATLVTSFTIEFKATDDSEARQKADEMAAAISRMPVPDGSHLATGWNTIRRMDGADD